MKIQFRLVAPWLVPLFCAACGVASAEQATASADDDSASLEEPVVVAQVDLASGQQVRFLATGPDMITVHETGRIGSPPVLKDQRVSSVAELYRKIVDVPDPQVVATLERADEAAARLEAADDGISPPIEEASGRAASDRADGVGVSSAALSLIANSTWANVDQLNREQCLLNAFDAGGCWYWYWNVDTGYHGETSHVRSLVVHAWNVGTVSHRERRYKCITEVGGACFDYEWRTVATHVINPGTYSLMTSSYFKTRYLSATTDAALHHIGLWDYR